MKNILYKGFLYSFITMVSLMYGDTVYSFDHGLLIQKPISAIIIFLLELWCFSDILEKLKIK